MNHVIRRTLFLLLCTLALVGCGASERDALTVGEQSISEEGLTDLVLALNPGGPDPETIASLQTSAYREVGAIWLQLFARFDYLESSGVVLEESARESAKERIEQLISEGRLNPVSRESQAFDALVVSDWLSTQPGDVESPEALNAIESSLRESSIASRIGTLDLASLEDETRPLLIVPRG